MNLSKLVKKASEEVYGKDIKGFYWVLLKVPILSIGNKFLTKREVSTNEAIKSVLS